MLDQTPRELCERQALRINPLKACQPVGALYAALGVRRCLPHSHGSQGCASYHRSFLSRHFKEPAPAASSSFTEGASVFGGGANLKAAVRNIFDIYAPDLVAIHTTCLSETIGDDVGAYLAEMDMPEGKRAVHASTPSYSGSHVTGYAAMVAAFVRALGDPSAERTAKVGILPGWANPGDARELRRLCSLMGLSPIILPDHAGAMDAPMTGSYRMFPEAGTLISDIAALGGAQKVLALGAAASTEPALAAKGWLGSDAALMPQPMGVKATDDFLTALTEISGSKPPGELAEERGRLIDLMLDMGHWLSGAKAAVFGDPDAAEGLCAMCLELGLVPALVFTGTPGEGFVKKVQALLEGHGLSAGATIRAGSDLFELHQRIKGAGVDVLIGSSYGKQIAKAEGIPLVRAGFPVLDRYGHASQPLVGYRGVARLAELVAGALMDKIDRDCADEDLEMVM